MAILCSEYEKWRGCCSYHFVGRGSSAGVDVNQDVVNFVELEVE